MRPADNPNDDEMLEAGLQEKVLDNTYRLLEEIGRGGFGAVYRGVRLGAEGSGQVAIKLLNRNPKLVSEDYIRFQREATVMSQLVHPGIVTVFELSEDSGSYFIAMEFISGSNLREFVKARGGKLSLTEIIDIILQAAEALDYVHAHAIIHRDIKPQNMLIEERNERGERRNHVKLVDFGVARLGEGGAPAGPGNESVVGTYAYMAPESTGLTQWEMDARADVYSLGIVAYELVAGKVPFYEFRNDELLRAHVEREPPPIRSIRGQDVPVTVENIIRKCIAKNPADRYQSMFGLVCDLKRVQVDLRSRGVIDDFPVGRKDIGIGALLERTFVGRDGVVSEIVEHLSRTDTDIGVEWGVIRSGVGIGKTRCLQEVRRCLEARKVRVLNLRFSESEQRLPLQSLSLAINDLLSQYQRTNKSAFRKYIVGIVSQLGPTAVEMGRFIPILRQFAITPSGEIRSADDSSVEFESVGQDSEEVFSISRSLDRRYIAPNQRLNDAIILLLSGLLGGDERFVFLMDDLHLADTSMLSLLTYLLEQAGRRVKFSILFTMRDKQSRPNLILENFVRRLSETEASLRVWTLLPFERMEIHEFFKAIGMANSSDEFIAFVSEKSGGSVLQLTTLVKQMLAQDALIPTAHESSRKNSVWSLTVDWERLRQIAVDFVSIEILLAALDTLERWDMALLKVAAVSYDACDFEYFLVEQALSAFEVEQRLLGLVQRGFFEIVGDEHAPIQRRAFVLSHEKIRNAVLSKLDLETRRHIHHMLATRIITLYRTPKKEQILALAKHCDGAAEKIPHVEAVKAFLRAAKVYIAAMEYNQARYYIDKAMESTNKISVQRDRVQRLRDCYEAEYMIQAAQGNLVEASEVCRSLLEITYDPAKRETLQVFWAQLLLGLGRHQLGYRQSRDVVENRGVFSLSKIHEVLALFNDKLMGTFLYPHFIDLLGKMFPGNRQRKSDVLSQAIIVMALAHLHGGQARLGATLSVAARIELFSGTLDRDKAVMRVVLAIMLLNRGKVSAAYRLCEDSEYFLQTNGLKNQQRWVIGLRSIWIDYPMGRMDRLHALVDTDAGMMLPSSGIMHFESYGLRAWLTLISPSSRAAQSAATVEDKRRRKSDREKRQGKAAETAGKEIGGSNTSRRVLDSGENSQYTALALFSDSIRFAMSDKIEPLRRAVEQLRRQSSVSTIGDAFADYAFSFQALVLGHQHEGLKFYQRGTMRLVNMKVEIASLVVCDALRFAAMVLPLLAVSLRARGWPWGESLRNALSSLNGVLRVAEGLQNPRRNAITPLFDGFLAFLAGRQKDAFGLMERAVMESRTQRSELIEAIAMSLMGAFSGRSGQQRAAENFVGALDIARRYDLRLIERYLLGLANITKVDLVDPVQKAEDSHFSTCISREKQSTIGLSEILVKMQSLHSAESAKDLLVETIRILKSSLRVEGGRAYVRDVGKMRFSFVASDGHQFAAGYDDRWIVKLLPNSADDPVRVLSMEESDSQVGDGTDFLTRSETGEHTIQTVAAGKEETVQFAGALSSEATNTRALQAPTSDITAVVKVEEGTQARPTNVSVVNNQYLVLLALVSNKSLLGWVAVPNVAASAYSSREVEQDLVLLGLHVGHLLVRMEPALLNEDDLSPESIVEQGARDIMDGEIPRNIVFETHGKTPSGTDSGWRVFGLRNDQVVFSQWRISCKNIAHAKKVGEFIGRHMQFFAYSARQSSEVLNIDNLILKMSSDLITILENVSSEFRLDDVKISIVIWDNKERRSVEGDFGGESFGFGGNSEVEREYLQEIHGILTSDRLVYHERSRKIPGVAGWIFGASDRMQSVYANFSRVEFVEQFLQERSQRGMRLVNAFKNESHVSGSFFAFFIAEQD